MLGQSTNHLNPGGLVLAALQIAWAIRKHKGKVTVFVPHYAMSGATLIALSADEIVNSKHAVLGPIDPQLGELPAASLLKVVEQKPISEIDDETLMKADVGRKASGIPKRQLPAGKAEGLAEKLSLPAVCRGPHGPRPAYQHGHAGRCLRIHEAPSQPVRARGGGVEYVPIPKQKEAIVQRA